MCGEVVAAPLSLQDTVYPILRKKSLHFCEKSKKFLKLCTAVRKKCKLKCLRKGNLTPSVKTCRFCQLPLGGSQPSQAHCVRQLSQRESQAVKSVAKVLGAKRNFPAVDLALPLGELAKP